MGDFIRVQADGSKKQVEATVVSAGAPNAGEVVKTGADGRLDPSLFPAGLGDEAKGVVASEALSAGDLVNIFDNAGVPNVRRADASAVGREAIGFVLDNFSAADTAVVFFEGENTAQTGLVPGSKLYLSADTPGAATATAPVGVGNVVQRVGTACATTSYVFIEDEGVCLG